jgi:hypothetical protein
VVLASEDFKSIENDDHGEVEEGQPSGVWLEMAPEDEGIAVNTLRFERPVELDVGETDGTPCEERGDGGQVLIILLALEQILYFHAKHAWNQPKTTDGPPPLTDR